MATQSDPKSDLSPRKVADRFKEEGRDRLDRGKEAAAQQVDQVASALKSAGDELGASSTLGNYANHFAGSIGRFGRHLRESSIEDLASDMQAAARRNPTMFVLGGLALGIALSRLIRAATSEASREDGYDEALGMSDLDEADMDASAFDGGRTRAGAAADPSDLNVSTDASLSGASGNPSSPRTFGE
jgi:hypothetical protein